MQQVCLPLPPGLQFLFLLLSFPCRLSNLFPHLGSLRSLCLLGLPFFLDQLLLQRSDLVEIVPLLGFLFFLLLLGKEGLLSAGKVRLRLLDFGLLAPFLRHDLLLVLSGFVPNQVLLVVLFLFESCLDLIQVVFPVVYLVLPVICMVIAHVDLVPVVPMVMLAHALLPMPFCIVPVLELSLSFLQPRFGASQFLQLLVDSLLCFGLPSLLQGFELSQTRL